MNLTVDGERVFAATGGRPFDTALPAVVFVHGAGMDHTNWALQTRYFAHRGRSVLAVDLPGHGKSGGKPLASIGDIADWLARLIEAAGLENAALAGHSMGALAVLDCAARHSGKVRALALLGVAPKMPVHPDLLAAAAADDHRAFELVTDWGHGPGAHRGRHPAPGLWMLGGAEALLERCPPGVLHNDLAACNAYRDAPAAAAKVACPTLLVLGADDRMTPARAGQTLAEAIPDARTALIPGSGHMMMTEASDATLDALKTIL